MEIKYIEIFDKNQISRRQHFIKVKLTNTNKEDLKNKIKFILETGEPQIIKEVSIDSTIVHGIMNEFNKIDLEINMLIPAQYLDERNLEGNYNTNRNRIIQMGDKFLWEIGVEKLVEMLEDFKRAENTYKMLGNIPNYNFATHLETFIDLSINDKVVETYFTIVS